MILFFHLFIDWHLGGIFCVLDLGARLSKASKARFCLLKADIQAWMCKQIFESIVKYNWYSVDTGFTWIHVEGIKKSRWLHLPGG